MNVPKGYRQLNIAVTVDDHNWLLDQKIKTSVPVGKQIGKMIKRARDETKKKRV